MQPDRRRFLAGSLAAVAAPRLSARTRQDPVRVAVIGLGTQGIRLLNALRTLEGVQVVALSDCDELRLGRTMRRLEHELDLAVTVDYRLVLERPDVDAVVLATPDHWHALQVLWACEAGKDVWVEAPLTLTLHEGERVAEAVSRHGRIVECALPWRSEPAHAAALDWIGSGELGPIRLVRAIVHAPQRPIGKADGNLRLPDTLDYDLWCGPAPLVPLRRARVHHDWRYRHDTGTGELGASGVHALDASRRALGSPVGPLSTVSLGGRLGPPDPGETPNAQIVFHTFAPVPLLCELRGLPRDQAEQAGDWIMDDVHGMTVGAIVHADGGSLQLSEDGAVAHDPAGAFVQRWPGDPEAALARHLARWIEALRSRDAGSLACGVEEARRSAALVQASSASQRLATPRSPDELAQALSYSASLSDAHERLFVHLEANRIDLRAGPLALGPCLEFEGTTCTSHPEAAPFLTRRYRTPFVLPDGA
jgi:predicted dehydrogenase